MSSFRHPLIATVGERAVGDNKDPKLVNAMVEIETVGKDDIEAWVQKRPGLKSYDNLSAATTDTGRGVFNWDGRVYSVIGDELFNDETDIGQLNTSSGIVRFDVADMSIEVPAEVAGPYLVFHDGTTLYAVDDENNIREYNNGGSSGATDVENLPTTILPGIVVLDQYVFLGSNGDTAASTNINEIHNSNVGDLSTWSGDFIVGELKADRGVAIGRYYNYLVSFNQETTEFFFDAANPVGTPLSRFDGVLEHIGTPAGAGNTVAGADNALCWVARSPQSGRFVAMLKDGFKAKKISTTAIDEYLEAEDSNISNAYAYHLRVAGNNLYVLTLPTTAAKTFVYDIDTGMWYLWTSDVSDTESYFTVVDSTYKNGQIIGLDEDNGLLYELDPETYQDQTGSNETIKFEIQTKRFDNSVQLNKFYHRLFPVCDFNTSGTSSLLVSWSDDDYTTFVSDRTLDLTNSSVFLTRLGMSRRRSWRLRYRSNNSLRIMALDGDASHGYYGR